MVVALSGDSFAFLLVPWCSSSFGMVLESDKEKLTGLVQATEQAIALPRSRISLVESKAAFAELIHQNPQTRLAASVRPRWFALIIGWDSTARTEISGRMGGSWIWFCSRGTHVPGLPLETRRGEMIIGQRVRDQVFPCILMPGRVIMPMAALGREFSALSMMAFWRFPLPHSFLRARIRTRDALAAASAKP
jgi:hypothetical protein